MVTLDQVRWLVARNRRTDGSSLAWCSLDKAMSSSVKIIWCTKRRGDLEGLLRIGFRRWAPVDFAVVVNERQVLALLIGIGFLHWTR